jgi:hypothetical protein
VKSLFRSAKYKTEQLRTAFEGAVQFCGPSVPPLGGKQLKEEEEEEEAPVQETVRMGCQKTSFIFLLSGLGISF